MESPLRAELERARAHRHVGQILPEDARLKLPKRAIIRAGRALSNEQVVFNEATLAVLDQVADRLDQLARLTERVEATVAEVQDRVARVEERLDWIQTRDSAVANEVRALSREVASMASRGAAPEGPSPAPATASDPALEQFYQDFEDRHRGSREEVEALLHEHLSLVEELAGGDAPLLDIGCGRGEWLELLRDRGVPAQGIDLNRFAVERAAERGLDVVHGDAIAHMRELPEGSLGAVTAFHLVEHLPFGVLFELVDAAHRALRPGGLLLIETPNCANLQVGATSFWLDPTHARPVHPELLQFLLKHRGFAGVTVTGIHPKLEEVEEGGPLDEDPVRNGLLHAARRLLFGPQDVLVAARKANLGRP